MKKFSVTKRNIIRKKNAPVKGISRLKFIRLMAGISQSELGAAVGVHRMEIIRWECGKFRPRAKNLVRLAEVLKVEPEAIFSTEMVFKDEK